MSALSDIFTDIANAIRTRAGVSSSFTPAQMPSAINAIPLASNKLYYIYARVRQSSFSSVYFYAYLFINEAQKAKLKTLAGSFTASVSFYAVVWISAQTTYPYSASHRRWDCSSSTSSPAFTARGQTNGVSISISTYQSFLVSISELDNLPSIDLG